MSNIPPWFKSLNIDPAAPVSTIDVARIAMSYCDHRIQENNMEERLRTGEELKSIISTLGSLAKAFRVNTDAHEASIADLSLKINSISIYFEQLLSSLKSGLHDAFFRIGSDMRQVFAKLSSGHFCDNTSQDPNNLNNHETLNHAGTSTHQSDPNNISSRSSENTVNLTIECSLCDQTFRSTNNLQDHMKTQHSNEVQLLSQHCPSCDNKFTSCSELSNHIKVHHTPNSSLRCNYCQEIFKTTASLQNHLKSKHSQYTCNRCGKSLLSFDDLCEHTKSNHNPYQFFPCHDCELLFDSLLHLEEHTGNDHDNRIPQFDGPSDEIAFDFDNFAPVNTEKDAAERINNYTFNKEKQTQKIVKDALKNDYEVTLNNCDQNAIIRCNPGFYIQVARSSLDSLKNNSMLKAGNITVAVDEITISRELNYVEATKLIKFSLLSDQKKVGFVSVPLHHSTRTIQVQGNSTMPDKSKAALWFTNFITDRFKVQAKAKSYAIKNTNESITKAANNKNVTRHTHSTSSTQSSENSCFQCKGRFDTRCRPSSCENCAEFFHKTTCLKDHQKLCTSQQSLTSLPCSAIPGLKATVTFVPHKPSTIASSSTIHTPTPTHVSSASLSTSTATTSSSNTCLSVVPASTFFDTPRPISSTLPATFTPLPSSTTSHSSNTLPPPNSDPLPRQNRKKTKTNIPTTPDQARIDFLQAELNSAQARIVHLDAAIVDKDQRVSILMARLKLFEEKQANEIHEKYFPTNKRAQSTPCDNQTSSFCSPCASSHSCARGCASHCGPHTLSHVACSHFQHHHDTPKHEPNNEVGKALDKLSVEVADLSKATKEIKAWMESQIRNTEPLPIIVTEKIPDNNLYVAGPSSKNTPPISPPEPTINESFASIEEFIDEESVRDDPLNC